MEDRPTPASVQRLASKNKAFTEAEKVYPRNYKQEPTDLTKVTAPAELKPTDKAVSEYILRTLKADPKHRFNSVTIGKAVHISERTVKRSLKKLQRLGYLRLQRLKTGHVNYLWCPNQDSGSLTSYDAAESLLTAFPEIDQLVCPLGAEEAIRSARELGFTLNESRSLWKEFKQICSDVCLHSGEETWNKWLHTNLRIRRADVVIETLEKVEKTLAA